jgi:ribosomal protein L18E
MAGGLTGLLGVHVVRPAMVEFSRLHAHARIHHKLGMGYRAKATRVERKHATHSSVQVSKSVVNNNAANNHVVVVPNINLCM